MDTAQREPFDHLDQPISAPTFANTEVAALYQAGKLSRIEADVYDAATTEEQEPPYFALVYPESGKVIPILSLAALHSGPTTAREKVSIATRVARVVIDFVVRLLEGQDEDDATS